MTLTEILSNYFVDKQYDDLPQKVADKAKENVIDTLAGAIPAVVLPDVAGVRQAYKSKYDKQDDCVLWGTKEKASVLTAAIINGTTAHALEMDDFHPQGKCHMGIGILPTVLCLGEVNHITGKEALMAIVAGYEVGLRVAISVGTASHRLRGWHATCTCGVFGAAMAAAKVLKLNEKQMVSALGLAGTQASGLWAFMQDGAGNKKFHGGHAAECGVNAAIIASGGLTGPSYILEATDGGFFKAVSDNYDCDRVVTGLGENWDVMKVGRKPYACCRSMHLSIDGILELREKEHLKIEDIEKIDVFTYEIGVKQCGVFLVPKNKFEAAFSIPYGIAVALEDGVAGISQFSEERIKDEKLLNFCRKITVVAVPKYTGEYPKNWGCEMHIYLKNGRKLEKTVWNGKGSADNPLTKDDLILKFKSLAGQRMDNAQMDKIINAIYDLDKCNDIAEFTKLLSC